MDIEQEAMKLLKMSRAQWYQAIMEMRKSDVREIYAWLNGLTQRSAQLAEYAGHLVDTGDNHDDAVREANKVLIKVREAIGYTIPARGVIAWQKENYHD